MKMRYGFSGDISEIATRSIRWASGGAYPHCFVVFYQAFDLVSGTQEDKGVYFESRVSKFIDQATKKTKTGVRGPRSIDVVRKWAAGDPDKRYWELLPAEGSGKFLPFTEDEVWAAYNMCCESVHTVSYAKLQIFQDLIAQKTGIRIGRGNKDNYKWTCSEMAARVTPWRGQKHLNVGEVTYNQVVPSGTKMSSIYEGAKRLISAEGTG